MNDDTEFNFGHNFDSHLKGEQWNTFGCKNMYKVGV